jgi:hypothetical protein
MFRFNQTIIREPTVCASLKLQYWCQLIYFVIKLFGRVTAYQSSLVGLCIVQSETRSALLCTVHNTHTNRTGLICGHTTERFNNEVY